MDFDKGIVEVYWSLLGIARRCYCHDERAHDLAAEAVTRALEARDTYDGSRPLLTWCRAIMRNLWINTLQRLDTKNTVPMGEWDNEGGIEADQLVRTNDINAILADLSGKSVCVDVLVDYSKGYSIAEIAHERGVPEGTVKRRIHDARVMLRDALDE